MLIEFIKSLFTPTAKPKEWKEGNDAYYAGSSEKSNPYPANSIRYDRWLAGFYGKVLLLLICLLPLSGCTDAEISKFTALGNKHRIELWSGGKMVREWKSTGKVESESNSDGYYFTDGETNELVRVTGDLVITSLDE